MPSITLIKLRLWSLGHFWSFFTLPPPIGTLSQIFSFFFSDASPYRTLLSPETKNLIKGNYKVNFMGGGEPYAEIQYKVGKNNQAEETIYSTIINVDSLAEIRLDSETIENYNDEFMDGSPSVYVVFERPLAMMYPLYNDTI